MFKKISLTTFLFIILLHGKSSANTCGANVLSAEFEQFAAVENDLSSTGLNHTAVKNIKLIALLQKATVENKKVTAAILTLTLGMLGVHRIYLGTAPYIPAVYLFTFGGGFFILPIIDLVMILSTNDLSKFENNNRILMWTKE